MIALEGTGLGRRYGGFTAVYDVDIAVQQGEVLGLIGPNGAGKSTLIDILSGRRSGHSVGEVKLNGRLLTDLGPGERRLLGLSRSFQRASIFPTLSVYDQIKVAARKIRATDADLSEIVSELQLSHIADHAAQTISYGDQRRLDLALALVGRPSVLLLDEPAAGLTAQESILLAQHLRSLVSGWNVTVLIVEHDMEVVFGICDRIVVMQLGRKLAEGTPDEIRRDKRVIDAYLGSE
jgi:branched-chain amino acid transport system ATP-binding protein